MRAALTLLPLQVKLSQCEVEDNLQGCITSSQLPFLLPLLQQSMQLAKRGTSVTCYEACDEHSALPL